MLNKKQTCQIVTQNDVTYREVFMDRDTAGHSFCLESLTFSKRNVSLPTA